MKELSQRTKEYKLSIIIPVYNAAPYITNTIEKVIRMGEDIEIVVVNDGSKDDTYSICLELQKRHPSILVLTQANAGVSIARNKGLENAHGKWLFFCDADDWIDADNLQQLLGYTEKYGEEFLMLGAMNFVKKEGIFLHPVPDNQVLSPNAYLHSIQFQGSACNHIFPARLIKDNNIRFPENVKNTEDSAFNIKAISCCKGVYSLNIPIYNYNRLNDSAAHVANKTLSWRLGPLMSCIDILAFCREHNIEIDMVDTQIDRLVEYFYRDHTFGKFSNDDVDQVVKYLREIGNQCPVVEKSLKYKALTAWPRMGLMLLKAYNKIKYNS